MSEAQVKATPNLSELQDIARCLNSLLYAPHPGLSTWRQALDAQLRAIQPFTPSHDNLLEALKGLTALIRDVQNVYGVSAAKWMMEKPSYKAAAAAIKSAEEKQNAG